MPARDIIRWKLVSYCELFAKETGAIMMNTPFLKRGESIMHGVRKKIRIPRKIAILCALALLIAAAAGILLHVMQRPKQQTIYTASYLKSIILKSDLSTRSVVYNGIAEVHNPKSPDKIDYYVSYKAIVKTGINFEKLKVEVEDTDVVKTVYITLPPAYITGVEVDAGSLDYIFVNKKANNPDTLQTAYAACEADVRAEVAEDAQLLELAQTNAEEVVRALTEPLFMQYGSEYNLVVNHEGES